MTEEEREMDFQLAELREENATLRRQLNTAVVEVRFLRGCIHKIQSATTRAEDFTLEIEHDDKASY